MARPLLLDLYCKAGGAAKGYYDAGFEVIGVDIDKQPHYPYEFYRADVLSMGRTLLDLWRDALRVDWMTTREMAQAIPPVFTRHIGKQIKGRL